MNSIKSVIIFFVMLTVIENVFSQRSPYAGSRPSGYKDKFVQRNATANPSDNEVVSRFGTDNRIDGTQKPPVGVDIVQGEPIIVVNRLGGEEGQIAPSSAPSNQGAARNQVQQLDRLPYDARGDADLVNVLLSRPIEQQPFWLVNYQAIEAHRNSSSPQQNYDPTARRSFFAG